jgi:uncharacterized protein YbaP (TraB family)
MILWNKILYIVLFSTVLVVADTGFKNPFLWEVNKGSEKFYLFGTIHLADSKISSLPLVLKKTIDKSDEVRTEVRMDADFQIKSAMHMMRHDGKDLKTLLSVELYSSVENYLKGINPRLTMVAFEGMKVWGLSMVVTMLENQMKNSSIQALDMNIYTYAKQMGKGVDGVESIEEQIAAMDSFTLEEQIADLNETVAYLRKNRDFIDKMKNVYMEGNSHKMMALIKETMLHSGTHSKVEKKFMQVMLYDRNTKMTNVIVQSVKSYPKSIYFFAFGVMHFLGEQSILTKLEAQGYSIRRIH